MRKSSSLLASSPGRKNTQTWDALSCKIPKQLCFNQTRRESQKIVHQHHQHCQRMWIPISFSHRRLLQTFKKKMLNWSTLNYDMLYLAPLEDSKLELVKNHHKSTRSSPGIQPPNACHRLKTSTHPPRDLKRNRHHKPQYVTMSPFFRCLGDKEKWAQMNWTTVPCSAFWKNPEIEV